MKKKYIFISLFIAACILIIEMLFSKPVDNVSITEISKEQVLTTPQPTTPTSEVKSPKRWPIPIASPIMKAGDSMPASPGTSTMKPKRYLIKNPIKIDEESVSQNENGINIQLRYPQIKGLADTVVQSRINDDIKGYADRLVENAKLYSKDLKEVMLHYNITANYNNVICINIYQNVWLNDDTFLMPETLLYELVDGRRLELRDLFNSCAGFPRILNRSIEEYILKRNLEEQILKSSFKGIREGQRYELGESTLTILLDKNDEFTFNMMINQPSSITFKLAQFSGYIDIYDKFSNPAKKIYISGENKRKMIPNDFEARYINLENVKDNYRSTVHGSMFTGMKNLELQEKLNAMCSNTAEEEFKKLLPEIPKKIDDFNVKPYIIRSYFLTGNYCDVICIEGSEYYSIPGGKSNKSKWHTTYNIINGKTLELKDIFKNDFDWKASLIGFIKQDSDKRNVKLEEADWEDKIDMADFWFSEEVLSLNLSPEIFIEDERLNENIFHIPFEYIGDENCAIRE